MILTSTKLKFTVFHNGVNPDQPLLYAWRVDDELIYIGKASRGAHRPLTQYQRNVRNLLDGKPYRLNKPVKYRRIHHALAQATHKKRSIVLEYLCNASPDGLEDAEREAILTHRPACNGKLPLPSV